MAAEGWSADSLTAQTACDSLQNVSRRLHTAGHTYTATCVPALLSCVSSAACVGCRLLVTSSLAEGAGEAVGPAASVVACCLSGIVCVVCLICEADSWWSGL